MQPEHCNYYGILKGRKPKTTLGEYILDSAYQRILDKHEESLIKRQDDIVLKLKRFFNEECKKLELRIHDLNKRLQGMEQLSEVIGDAPTQKPKKSKK